MKEQWKKHDSDAKLLHNVEEGIPQPIKIEFPISAFQLKQDGCCNRLITFLRVAVYLVLLLILCWTAATLYSNYYPRQLVIGEKIERLVSNQHDSNSEENKASFRNKVYRMSMFDDQDAVQNEIDSYTATSAPESLAASELPVDKVSFRLENMGYLPPMIQMKNVGGIRIIDFTPNQENKNENELHNINSKSLETRLHDYIFKERFNLENVPEAQFVNEDDIPVTDQRAYVKLVNSPLEIPQVDHFAKRFNLEVEPEPKSDVSIVKVTLSSSPDKELASDKEDPMEGFKNIYKSAEEDDKNEIVTIPNLEDENAQQSDEDLTKYEPIEVDDIDQLISDIVNLMGIYEESSSEVNQPNEESAAVIQEEIKNNEEKLEIVDLENVSSAEEKSQEQSVAVVQEEIKDDNDDLSIVHFVTKLEPSSEVEDPDVEAVAVEQEEIKSESDQSFNPVIISNPIKYGHWLEPNYQDPWKSNEDDPTEKSQEKTSSEDTSIDDFDKNISQDVSSVEDKSREILPTSETTNSPQLPLKPITKRDYTVTLAKLLVPFVGNNYELAHWYYSTFLGPLSPRDDKKKMYAAKILYSEKISEFDSDMEMWLNEILEDPYISDFSDIINPQKQIEADTFLENQIADKILEKIQLKAQYDFNMINSDEAVAPIARINSNHLKSWFLATHPSINDREPIRRIVLESMDARRKLYPLIKDDLSKVRTELHNENTELELLKFDEYDFSVEPMISTLEVFRLYITADILQKLFEKEKDLPYNENVSPVEEHHLRQIQQAIIDAQKKKLEKEDDYSEESNSKQQSIIEAMKQVAEEYDQTEKSSEETTTSLVESYNKVEKSEEETEEETKIKNDDEENDGLTEETSPNSNQFESMNTNLKPIEEFPFPTASDELMNEEEFLKWAQEQMTNYKPEDIEQVQSSYDPYDPFDY